MLFISRQQESYYYPQTGRDPDRQCWQSECSFMIKGFSSYSNQSIVFLGHSAGKGQRLPQGFSPSDCQHTGEGAACALHHPVPHSRIHHQSWMDKGWPIVSLFTKRKTKYHKRTSSSLFRGIKTETLNVCVAICHISSSVSVSVHGRSWWTDGSRISS